MNIIKKLFILTFCTITTYSIYTMQQNSQSTVTNGTQYNVSVIFYDLASKALTSPTNISRGQKLNIPQKAIFIDIKNSSLGLTYLKANTSYLILYNNNQYSLQAV